MFRFINRWQRGLVVFFLLGMMLSNVVVAAKHELNSLSQLQENSFFEKNNGQYPVDVLFAFKGKRGMFFIKEDKAEFIVFSPSIAFSKSTGIEPSNKTSLTNAVLVEMQFLNALTEKNIMGVNPLDGYINYLTKNHQQAQTKNGTVSALKNTRVSLFNKVKIENIYSGIDLVFRFRDGRLEYDYIVHPGADPDNISIKIVGAEKIQYLQSGRLLINTEFGDLIHNIPEIFQLENYAETVRRGKSISGKFNLNDNIVSFSVADYDQDKILVIDPVINFSTYLGGVFVEQVKGLKVDSAGNIFVAGLTSASAVLQEDINEASGFRLTFGYEKFIGDDFVFDKEDFIAVEQETNFIDPDSASSSTALQTVHGIKNCNYEYKPSKRGIDIRIDYDAFLAKYDPEGVLLYATYIGGCGNDAVRGMDMDSDGNIYLGGFTLSADFPTQAALQKNLSTPAAYEEDIEDRGTVNSDGFIMKFDNDGGLIYSTYIGGDDLDGVRGIEVDSNQRLHIVGYTYSRNWVNANPVCITDDSGSSETKCFQGSDGFVARLAATGDVLSYVHIIGGSGDDWTNSITLVENPADINATQVYISGNTVSADLFPSSITPSYQSYKPGSGECSRADPPVPFDLHPCEDAYFMRLSNNAATIDFASFLGGDFDDTAVDIGVDTLTDSATGAIGNIYIAGTTASRGGTIEAMLEMEPSIATTQIVVTSSDSADLVATKQLLLQLFPLYRRYLATPLIDDGQRRAFVTKFNPIGSELIYSTFLNGLNHDAGNVMEVTDEGIVYLAGQTTSLDFPVVNAFSNFPKDVDAFVSKIESELIPATRQDGKIVEQVNLSFSTLLGGEGDDYITAMTLGAGDAGSADIYVAGGTESRSLPITDNATEAEYQGGESDVFLMRIVQQAPSTDLVLVMTKSDKEQHFINENLVYRINIQNNSAVVAEKVQLWIEILGGNVAASISSPDFTCIDSNAYKVDNPQSGQQAEAGAIKPGTHRCDLGDIPANQSIQQGVNITLTPSNAGIITVSTGLSSLTSDSAPNDNVSISTIQVFKPPSRASLYFPFLILVLFFLLLAGIFCVKPKLTAFSKR